VTGAPVAEPLCDAGPRSDASALSEQPWTGIPTSGYFVIDLDALAATDGGLWDMYFLKDGYTMLYSGGSRQRRLYVQRTNVGDGDGRPACPVHDVDGSGHRASGQSPHRHPGRHAAWYGQSGYPTLFAGATLHGDSRVLHSGSIAGVRGRMGEVVVPRYWNPEPGTGSSDFSRRDGQLGTPNTGWPDTTASPYNLPTTSVQEGPPGSNSRSRLRYTRTYSCT